jgi:hypothetical protein
MFDFEWIKYIYDKEKRIYKRKHREEKEIAETYGKKRIL